MEFIVQQTKNLNIDDSNHIVKWRSLPALGTQPSNIGQMKNEAWEFPELEQQLKDGHLSKIQNLFIIRYNQHAQLKGDNANSDVEDVPCILVIESDLGEALKQAIKICKKEKKSDLKEVKSTEEFGLVFKKLENTNSAYVMTFADGKDSSNTIVSNLTPYILTPTKFSDLGTLSTRLEDATGDITVPLKNEYGSMVDVLWMDPTCDEDDEGELEDVMKESKIPLSSLKECQAIIKAKIEEEKGKVTSEYNYQKAYLDSFTDAQKDLLEKIKVHKFYPSHPTISLKGNMIKTVNAYFGNASQVYPALEKVSTWMNS